MESLQFDPNHARVLVVGPMGAGKTSLVHALCHQQLGRHDTNRAGLRRQRPTVGCNVEVKLLAGARPDRFVEFWDVGGHPDAALARQVFLAESSIAGVLLVYDLSNPRSLRELRAWVDDLKAAGIGPLGAGVAAVPNRTSGNENFGPSSGALSDNATTMARRDVGDLEGGTNRAEMPTLLVGSKRDSAAAVVVVPSGELLPVEVRGCRHVCVSARALDEASFLEFFEKVFECHVDRETSAAGASGWASIDNANGTAGFTSENDSWTTLLAHPERSADPSSYFGTHSSSASVGVRPDEGPVRWRPHREISPGEFSHAGFEGFSAVGEEWGHPYKHTSGGSVGKDGNIVGRRWPMTRGAATEPRPSTKKQS